MKVSVIGTGYVGLVQAAGLAAIYNHEVMCMDINADRIANLKKGILPIHEPGLDTWVNQTYFNGQEYTNEGKHYIDQDHHTNLGKLYFTDALGQAVSFGEVIFICVGTPSYTDGSVNISALESLREDLWRLNLKDKVLIIKSTVPPGTTEKLFKDFPEGKQIKSYAMNPEFLREGYACEDFKTPTRTIIGYNYTQDGNSWFNKIYPGQETHTCLPAEAEMTKYVSNAFLAMKISFAHEVENITRNYHADPIRVLELTGLDDRIGSKFLHPGIGFGGSCFPKDTKGYVHIANSVGCKTPLIEASIQTNMNQLDNKIAYVNKAIKNAGAKRVALLGRAFKEGTDDIRDSMAIQFTYRISNLNPDVTFISHDPKALWPQHGDAKNLELTQIISELTNIDMYVVLTPWKEYAELLTDDTVTHKQSVIDLRNMPELYKNFCIFSDCRYTRYGWRH